MSKRLIYDIMKLQNTSKCKEIEHWMVKILFYAVFSEILGLGDPYCTNLEYKLVLLIQKRIWMICISMRLVYDTSIKHNFDPLKAQFICILTCFCNFKVYKSSIIDMQIIPICFSKSTKLICTQDWCSMGQLSSIFLKKQHKT